MTPEIFLKISQIASNWGQPVSVLTVVGICFWQAKMLNGRLKGKVTRDTCHASMKGIEDKIETLDEHISQRFDDLKDVVLKNGKK